MEQTGLLRVLWYIDCIFQIISSKTKYIYHCKNTMCVLFERLGSLSYYKLTICHQKFAICFNSQNDLSTQNTNPGIASRPFG